eukprot:TRINITY_DN10375_c0_g1_i1.p2 TRINITY_DN10375_c0_g1~~TRINITY_DN10375_c0_g1_i1.p2  ORF type:complete len:190 (+),score=-22.92 TRINITY_DN10375_c0_g1_i1:464-1033(+)
MHPTYYSMTHPKYIPVTSLYTNFLHVQRAPSLPKFLMQTHYQISVYLLNKLSTIIKYIHLKPIQTDLFQQNIMCKNKQFFTTQINNTLRFNLIVVNHKKLFRLHILQYNKQPQKNQILKIQYNEQTQDFQQRNYKRENYSLIQLKLFIQDKISLSQTIQQTTWQKNPLQQLQNKLNFLQWNSSLQQNFQ